jgi:hypothetical protein
MDGGPPGGRPSASSATSGSFESTASTPRPARADRVSSAPTPRDVRRRWRRRRSPPPVTSAVTGARSASSSSSGRQVESTCRRRRACSTSGRRHTSSASSARSASTDPRPRTLPGGSTGWRRAARWPDGASRSSGWCCAPRSPTPSRTASIAAARRRGSACPDRWPNPAARRRRGRGQRSRCRRSWLRSPSTGGPDRSGSVSSTGSGAASCSG